MSHVPADLVETFAAAVAAQNRCIGSGDPSAGNAQARKYVAAADALLRGGDESVEAFATLLAHSDHSVRGMAAAFLLKRRTEEAVAALRQVAQGSGLAALGAQMTLDRYSRGIMEIT
jgi:hypothetical protein